MDDATKWIDPANELMKIAIILMCAAALGGAASAAEVNKPVQIFPVLRIEDTVYRNARFTTTNGSLVTVQHAAGVSQVRLDSLPTHYADTGETNRAVELYPILQVGTNVFENARIVRTSQTDAFINSDKGIARVKLELLPGDIREKYPPSDDRGEIGESSGSKGAQAVVGRSDLEARVRALEQMVAQMQMELRRRGNEGAITATAQGAPSATSVTGAASFTQNAQGALVLTPIEIQPDGIRELPQITLNAADIINLHARGGHTVVELADRRILVKEPHAQIQGRLQIAPKTVPVP